VIIFSGIIIAGSSSLRALRCKPRCLVVHQLP
jgi:hypothetical protein